jgi:Ca2+-binding RTX toxin-like protein
MALLQPIADNIIRDDFTTDAIRGGAGNDHLIHHRDPSVVGHEGTNLASFYGDDILEGSVPDGGQIHIYAGKGNDWMILDVAKNPDAIGMQGHHVYAGHGLDTFQFTNIEDNHAPIVGRLDDYDPTSDRIFIEGTEIDLTDLPHSVTLPGGEEIEVRVIEIEHPEFIAEDLGGQYFLAIGEDIFYALDGARDLQNGTTGLTGEERHFLRPPALETLRSAETVQYENPKNFVPRDFYEDREDDLNLNWYPDGDEVFAETGDKDAAHMFGGKGNPDAASSIGEQVMHGSVGDDVIDGNTGNDTIDGGSGNDLIAGGIDNDLIRGGLGDDLIWGGDGDDRLDGDSGNDFLHGGRGDDFLDGGEGNDTLFGGRGDDTLAGGGGEDAINRFHFYEDGGNDIILDFKVGSDLITL